MGFRQAADGLAVNIGEMRQVHQVVDHHHVIGVDGEHRLFMGPFFGLVVKRVIEDFAFVRRVGIAHPDPDALMAFDHGIAAHAGAGGNGILPRNIDAFAVAVEHQPVIAAFQALPVGPAVAERRPAVTAAVFQRRRPAVRIAEQDDGLVHDGAADNAGFRAVAVIVLRRQFLGPGRNIPGVAHEGLVPGVVHLVSPCR